MMMRTYRLVLALGLSASFAAFLSGSTFMSDASAAAPPASALAPTPAPTATAAPVQIPLEDTPFEGPANAPIKTVVYSDFLCPHCKAVAQAFARFMPQSANRVAIYYKFFPLDGACNPNAAAHPGACWLAYGGVCAQAQGKFWPYHDQVFALDHRPPAVAPNREVVESVAASLKLDMAAFRSCLDAPRTKDHVAGNVQEGTRLDVHGTPAIFINNRRLGGPNEFISAVDQESKKLGLGPLAATP
jgi:protein-disulfide isomerase